MNGKSSLFVAFVNCTLSKIYSLCTQNFNFYYFLEAITKIVQYPLKFVYLFFPKITKNNSRKSFIKRLLSISVHNIPSYFYDLILT